MGVSRYDVYAKGPNPTIAFDLAVVAAQHESGHGGYTGTIAEKGSDGFRRVTNDPLPIEAARTLANRLIQDDHELVYTDKGGPANAIPIAPSSAFKTKHKVLNISTQQEGYLDHVAMAQERLKSATISDVEVIEDKCRTRVKRASRGKRITKFVVLDCNDHIVAREDTLPLAKKKALELCAAQHEGSKAGYFVKGESFADGGGPLFGCVQEQVSRKVKLKVTFVEQVRRDPAPIGWLFFGFASD